jgi:DNA-directed RNA polymerase beta subunit
VAEINVNLLDEPEEDSDSLLGSSVPAPAPAMPVPQAAPVPAPAPAMPVPQAAPTPPLMTPQDYGRELGDVAAARKAIYDKALEAASRLEPVTTPTHTLKLSRVEWADPERFSKKQHKEAVLSGQTLARRLRGVWSLVDNTTGQTIDERKQVIARVPHLTESGTFVFRGSEYAVRHQQRLRPGVFTRRKENGEIEAHVNIMPGKGVSHRYFLEPDKGIFYLRLGQAKMPLMPLLQALGADNKSIRDAWGPELYAANYAKRDQATIQKLTDRLVKPKDLEAAGGDASKALASVFERMEMDPQVTQRTLGSPYAKLDKNAILATTRKLLAVSRGETDIDDRDALAYQTFLGPEDLFAERLSRDRGGLRRALLFKAANKGNLGSMPSAALQKQIDSAITESGLGVGIEEINPAEILDKLTQISRLGEGGIPSLQSIPDEARDVQTSHFGFMDPLRTPESMRAGVDTNMSRGVRKGVGNTLNARFIGRDGKEVWKNPQEIADLAIGFPGSMRSNAKRVAAMKGGRIVYVPKNEVALEMGAFENAFSPLGNLVPMKSNVKGQRVSMASRMITQALPLVGAESPLVQSGIPGSRGEKSFEEEYGTSMGAIRASQGGRVIGVDADGIKVRYDDGKEDTIDLFNQMPYNRKTSVHQTATVEPGQTFRPGQLLATSNYTDKGGAAALGVNARIAYTPWAGMNFEDAFVISESMAKRFTSSHMYQHGVELNDRTRTGKKTYLSLFPAKYDKSALAALDDDGVVKVGQKVEYGSPLILAAEEKSRAMNKVHKQRQAGFNDRTVTWDHHDGGVVTDVVKTPKGPVVLVSSQHPMQVGDKMSGRYGDKGVVSAIIPDSQMPHGEDGKPFEVLANPLGVISRTNPAQWIEAALGKIAAQRGKPFKVEDFDEQVPDRVAWTIDRLREAGLKDTESLLDPQRERKIDGVSTGVRFFMKLHHMAECFDGETEALTSRGWVPWPEVRDDDLLATVDDGRLVYEKPVEVVRFPFRDGELYCYKGRYIDYAVTGNHRLYVRDPRGGDFKFRDAATMHGRRFCVPQFGFEPDAQDNPATYRLGEHKLSWDDYAELVGWWVSEGYAKVTSRRACVTIYQSQTTNPEKFARIEALVRRLPFPWHIYRAKGEALGVSISSRDLAMHLKAFGEHSQTKRLPRHVLSAPVSARRRCYEAMMLGDGNTQETPTGTHARYTTTSQGLADDFQELCIRVGLGAVIRPDPPRKETRFLPSWTCGVALTRTTAQVDGDRNKAGFSKRVCGGYVYCAEMRTGLLYVRRNGKPMLCGNSKGQGRGSGAYSSDDTPAKGGDTGSKRVSMLDVNALLSHGATEVLRDAGAVRGQRNDEYWLQFMQGHTPRSPKVPMVYEKFVNELKASGINVIRDGAQTNIMAMTDADVDKLAGDRVVISGDTVDWNKDLKPVKGGLFDEGLTGGHRGSRWAAIPLHEPMPSPVMEEPIRRVLGLTQKQFEGVISGTEELGDSTGPSAIAKALGKIDLDREIAVERARIANGSKSDRDKAVRKLGYLKSAKRLNLHPRDWVLSKVPVLPPQFRPVSLMEGSRTPLVADANYLYKELIEANNNLKDMQGRVGDAVGEERLALYNTFKAVTGLGDPVAQQTKEKNVKGLLAGIFGSSPKFGTVQRKLLATTVDNVGRAVITPNPDLDMDTVGLPEDRAFDVYSRFIVRRLKRKGMPMIQAMRHVREQSPLARQVMIEEMNERPIIINRAPVLHRFGIMAFRPVLTKGSVLQVSPLIVKGFGADFDGDAMQYHVPTDDEARKEALERMLPSRQLINPSDFKSPVHMPGQEYLGGAFMATSPKHVSKRPERYFRSRADVIKAWKRGEVNVNDRITILDER